MSPLAKTTILVFKEHVKKSFEISRSLLHFTDTFSLEHLINEPTCFKGSPSYIDLIITNRKSYFKSTSVTVTGIFNFHKLATFRLKSQTLKDSLKIKTSKNYKTFDENGFNEDLKSKLDSVDKLDYPLTESIFIDVLKCTFSSNG